VPCDNAKYRSGCFYAKKISTACGGGEGFVAALYERRKLPGKQRFIPINPATLIERRYISKGQRDKGAKERLTSCGG
jgi:hypothetical protein